ncbi:MAG: type VII secretion protein EssC, partial [Bacilli bacterium]|nr:type VII secretion protein EssC [Bacilli bacterium]
AHGPHGLIAGTTGAGYSEFIITYILSMCINYSPDDIAFILIDYKGGGLALAFENKTTGVCLPHLAGTITNLDKAEMDRTLVSIDSEVKRRQEMFNVARDKLGESTIDIYKYQRFYKEGKVDEPIPHLFIICDEFAELKAQQPDFMDNLISVARIGRSLGVHLILATQKPSGVVNDQIWSNTRFRVCLKVQDEADSKEMLKRPEAAYIKQAGRYYLQVGYDEYFALGQSGYAGSKYYPSDKIVKQVDKSINFINDFGQPIKSIQASSGPKMIAQGEQLQATMKLIIDVSNKVNKKARRLWLSNIPETILVDNLENKYSFVKENYHPKCILGEYDAPEKQEQGKVLYDFLEDGNTAIYGNDGSERENLLSTLIYSTVKNYTAEEVDFYLFDYGSESLRRFASLPHVGGMVFQGEDEKYNNLLKLLKEELSNRKKKFTDFGGEYKNYIKNSPNKLPVITVIVNNYDSIYEANPDAYDEFPDLVRDSERYGIIFIFTGNAINSIHSKISQNLPNVYAFKLKDEGDYAVVLNSRTKATPRDIFGRGLLNNDGIHEFQTASIVENVDDLNSFFQEFATKQKQINTVRAKRIPTLPDIVRFNDVDSAISDLHSLPIGIGKKDLEIETIDCLSNTGYIVTSNKIVNTFKFVVSLLYTVKSIANTSVIVFDPTKSLNLNKEEFVNTYTDNFEEVTDKISEYIEKL